MQGTASRSTPSYSELLPTKPPRACRSLPAPLLSDLPDGDAVRYLLLQDTALTFTLQRPLQRMVTMLKLSRRLPSAWDGTTSACMSVILPKAFGEQVQDSPWLGSRQLEI